MTTWHEAYRGDLAAAISEIEDYCAAWRGDIERERATGQAPPPPLSYQEFAAATARALAALILWSEPVREE